MGSIFHAHSNESMIAYAYILRSVCRENATVLQLMSEPIMCAGEVWSHSPGGRGPLTCSGDCNEEGDGGQLLLVMGRSAALLPQASSHVTQLSQ
jgi:hypothetical protein